jgi:hypothetical protein
MRIAGMAIGGDKHAQDSVMESIRLAFESCRTMWIGSVEADSYSPSNCSDPC